MVNVNLQAPTPAAAPDAVKDGVREQAPGEGRFNVYDAPASVWPDFLQGQAERPVRVLLVDSDVHMRRVIAQELMADARTMLVAQAASLREGRRAIKAHAFDVMLVDLQLRVFSRLAPDSGKEAVDRPWPFTATSSITRSTTS